MTLLNFSFKLLEILLYCQKIYKVIPKVDCPWPLTGSESKGRHV